jgi:hypothetical protein
LGPIWIRAGRPAASSAAVLPGVGNGGNGVKVVVLSRPAAAWRRGLYGPVLGPAGPAGSGMPLLPRPDGYRDSGGGSSLPRGCGAAIPGPCRPSFSVHEVSCWFIVRWRGWCQGRGGACWWLALMEGRLRILRVAVLWGSGEILVGLPTLTWWRLRVSSFLLEERRMYTLFTIPRVPGETLGHVRAAAASSSHSFLKVLLGTR